MLRNLNPANLTEHPASALFDAMSDDEFNSLLSDIRSKPVAEAEALGHCAESFAEARLETWGDAAMRPGYSGAHGCGIRRRFSWESYK